MELAGNYKSFSTILVLISVEDHEHTPEDSLASFKHDVIRLLVGADLAGLDLLLLAQLHRLYLRLFCLRVAIELLKDVS